MYRDVYLVYVNRVGCAWSVVRAAETRNTFTSFTLRILCYVVNKILVCNVGQRYTHSHYKK